MVTVTSLVTVPKPVPVIVIEVSPAVVPLLGERAETVGVLADFISIESAIAAYVCPFTETLVEHKVDVLE
jgi:hypothetical protein